MSKDLLLYENGDGGEIAILNNDITLVETLYQQVYIRLFGGNIEANTTGLEIESQERLDWWGNSLFFTDQKEKQFNSNTERTLENVSLNSSGRIEIERAVKSDLEGLNGIANTSVNVVILSTYKIRINVILKQPDGIEDKIFQYIWDNASKEVIIDATI